MAVYCLPSACSTCRCQRCEKCEIPNLGNCTGTNGLSSSITAMLHILRIRASICSVGGIKISATPHVTPKTPNLYNYSVATLSYCTAGPQSAFKVLTQDRRGMTLMRCHVQPWIVLSPHGLNGVDKVRPQGSGRAAKACHVGLRACILAAANNILARNICRDTLSITNRNKYIAVNQMTAGRRSSDKICLTDMLISTGIWKIG